MNPRGQRGQTMSKGENTARLVAARVARGIVERQVIRAHPSSLATLLGPTCLATLMGKVLYFLLLESYFR